MNKHEDRDGVDAPPIPLVIGIGGAGCNIVDRLMLPEGLRCRVGRREEERALELRVELEADGRLSTPDPSQLARLTAPARPLLIVAGLGGHTGSHIAPMLLELARDKGLTARAFYTQPFAFEAAERHTQAAAALAHSRACGADIQIFPNDDAVAALTDEHSLAECLSWNDQRLVSALQGLLES